MFYTNVQQRGNKIYMRGIDMGQRVTKIEEYKPYLFLLNPNGDYRTLDGRRAAKMNFDGIGDARDFMKRYEDVSNMEVFGFTSYPYMYIYDNFKQEVNYDPSQVNVGTLDLECKADEGFPDISKADKEITAITIRCRGYNYVYGCGEFKVTLPNTTYVRCKDELDLLQRFLTCWERLDLDVVTGWNIEFFDIPYLVNRIRLLFGEKEAKRLSPWRILEEKDVIIRGRVNKSYLPMGISILDYYQLYKKFTYSNQESYKLDYIAQIELGEAKIDYSEYGSLLELYKNNYQKFIEYNIHDCVLVERLDDKLKFIEQVMSLAYDAKVNYNDTLTTVKPWDVIIHNYLLDQGIVIPQFKFKGMDRALVGGHVKDPKIGLSKWVVSFDLDSLYPHLIMMYNISPEMFWRRIEGHSFPSVAELLRGDFDYKQFGTMMAVAANGCMYHNSKQGFLPALMEKMYADRVRYKKLMLEAKQRYEKTKDPNDAKLVSRYHNLQLSKKIQLNSAYGALGNEYFRWFNFNHAEAITVSGQFTIQWIEKKMNIFMNKMLKTTDVDYVVASDTDSIYVTMEKLVDTLPDLPEPEIVKIIDQFCNAKITPYMEKCYEELAEYMNAYAQKMRMKRETIANKAIWRKKKMYILNAWNVEGVQYDKPKLKIQGIEAVRSTTPYVCRERIKNCLSIIMNGTEKELQDAIATFRDEFLSLPFEEVARPSGVNGITKYADRNNIFISGTPIHVKGALLFNHLLKKHNLDNIPPISDGDKVKYVYLKTPNPLGDKVIATPDYLPDVFKLEQYIDYETQFEKTFLEPIKSIADVIDWNVEKRATLESFFG